MLYQMIREKLNWAIKKHNQHCRVINLVLLGLIIIILL